MTKTTPGRHRGHQSRHDSSLCHTQPNPNRECGYTPKAKHRNGIVRVGPVAGDVADHARGTGEH